MKSIFIYKARIKVNNIGFSRMSALWFVIRGGCVDLIDHIIDLDPSLINKEAFQGFPPLVIAASDDDRNFALSTVKLLILKGADVNTSGGLEHHTALWAAAKKKNIELVKYLILQGAKISKDEYEREKIEHIESFVSALETIEGAIKQLHE